MVVSGTREICTDLLKAEDEVRIAEMESKLREMVIAIARPSILKIANCKTDMEDLWSMLKLQGNQLQEIASEIQLTSERSNLILDFKHKLDDCSERIMRLDGRLSLQEKAVVDRLEALEHRNEMQAVSNSSTERTLQRVTQDFDVVHQQLRQLSDALDSSTLENRQLINAEADTLKASMGDLSQELQRFQEEVWGPEDCTAEVMPISLRRLDYQMRTVFSRCDEMSTDLAALRRLDSQMVDLSHSQDNCIKQVEDLAVLANASSKRVVQIAADTKEESRLSANRMAAFTASLLREVRGSVEKEVKALQSMHGEMEALIEKSHVSVDDLQRSVDEISAQVSAKFKQIYSDMDTMETRRRRDKQTGQENAQDLRQQLTAALEASETTLRGLEHVTSVVAMALQGERMSVALDVQDYVDRKAITYVGIRQTARASKGWEVRHKEGLDPTTLTRMQYEPQAITFQGNEFERAQLCALRERLLHTAQELLQQGPQPQNSGRARKALEAVPPPPTAPDMLGVSGELPSGRRSADLPGVSRPGSRGQPSARGSPMLDRGSSRGARATPDSSRQQRDARGSPGGLQDILTVESTPRAGEGAPHLPSLAAAVC